jgi:hypothetical protein
MKKVIVHCSDSKLGNALLIDAWHKQRGFDSIGYHFVILNGRPFESLGGGLDFTDGMIETGRNIDKEGAHCKGHNDSIGICLIGKSNSFTDNQIRSLKNLLLLLSEKYKGIEIFQHSDFDETKNFCAGFKPAKFSEIQEYANGK